MGFGRIRVPAHRFKSQSEVNGFRTILKSFSGEEQKIQRAVLVINPALEEEEYSKGMCEYSLLKIANIY